MNTPTQAAPAALVPFTFESHPVRVIVRDGEPWFVAKDLCAALHIVNSRSALAALDETEKGVGSTDTLGGNQNLALVNEAGMWTLVLRCRDAVTPGTVPYRVRKWVTHEVLPTIRKTGSYSTPAPNPVRLLVTADAAGTHIAPVAADTLIANPAELANAISGRHLTSLQLLAVMGVCAKMLSDSSRDGLRKTRAEKKQVMKSLSREIAI